MKAGQDKVWQVADGWARRCPNCNKEVVYHRPNALTSACSTAHSGAVCQKCRDTRKRKPKPEPVVRIGSSRKSKVVSVSDAFEVSNDGVLDREYFSAMFKRVTAVCGCCGAERVQGLPLDWHRLGYFCHRCGEHQEIQL